MAKDEEEKSSNVFIMDPDFGWRPATMKSQDGDTAVVEVPEYKTEQAMACDGGRAATGKEKKKINLKNYPHQVLPLQNVDANGNLVEFPDMVRLPYLHEVRYRNRVTRYSCVLFRWFGSTIHSCIPHLFS